MPDVVSANPPAHDTRQSWLDHPLLAEHYRARGLVDGHTWEEWVKKRFDGPAGRSLDLACGAGLRSFYLFENRVAGIVDGIDLDEDLIARAERSRDIAGAPGQFRVADLNAGRLPAETYDLIFVSHRLHQVVGLEHLLEQVHRALTPRGAFVVEGYVGPSRFQWTAAQMAVVQAAMSYLPERLRMLRWSELKMEERRPDRAAVSSQSPFEAIRSAEIPGLFRQHFNVVAERALGGTVQSLLYNGIMHNFSDDDAEAARYLEIVMRLEDVLLDTKLLPSDFALMIGARR